VGQQMSGEKRVGVALYLGICAVWLVGMITVHTLQWYHVIPDMRSPDRVCEVVQDESPCATGVKP
jgi:hypothetical protein